MRILYTVSTTSMGVGGHIYSLKTIAEALYKEHDVFILCIGPSYSPIISGACVNSQHIYFNGINFVYAYRNMRKIMYTFKPEIVHAFDMSSFLFARMISLRYKIKAVLTKCGGENPKIYWPYAENLILFSEENGYYFKQKRKFANSKIAVIPNRAAEVPNDINRLRIIKARIPPNKIVFLRIARFRPCYKGSFMKIISLVNDLNVKLGNKCYLILLGNIQDYAVYEAISKLKNSYIMILTSDEFTLQASQLIDCADIVLGTGRGLMEAASKSKVLLTPLKGSKYPLLVTKDNFEFVFRTNFSPRNQIDDFSEEDNFNAIARAVMDQSYKKELSMFAKEIFEQYFSVNKAIDKYEHFYKMSLIHYPRAILSEIWDIVLHILYIGRVYILREILGI